MNETIISKYQVHSVPAAEDPIVDDAAPQAQRTGRLVDTHFDGRETSMSSLLSIHQIRPIPVSTAPRR